MKDAQRDPTFHARVLDSMEYAVIALGTDGRILHWNAAATRIFGVELAALEGKSFYEFLADCTTSRAMLDRLCQLQSTVGEIVGRDANGNDIRLLAHARPLQDARGRDCGIVLQAESIGERQRGELEQRLLAEVGSILASSFQSETILDRLCRALVPSFASACTLFTADADGSIRAVAMAYDGPELSAAFMSRADGGIQSQISMFTELGLDSTISVMLEARDRSIGAIAFGRRDTEFDQRDIRIAEEIARRAAMHVDNQRLYEAAVVASKAKSDFLAVISHELRTPLTTIMGYAELMASGVPERLPAKSAGFLERVRTAAWHLLELIEQILVYARLEAGRETLMPEPVIVSQLMSEVRALMEGNAFEKGLHFVVDPIRQDLTVTTDLTKVRQILLNLASNAIKFTDEGELRICAQTDERHVIISVQDTGIGISAEHQERVFEPFWQVDQSATRRVGGAGLGLSVSRRLARLLGGDLTFTSLEEGGTRFDLSLPRAWHPREQQSLT